MTSPSVVQMLHERNNQYSPFHDGHWEAVDGAEEFDRAVFIHGVWSEPDQEMWPPDHRPFIHIFVQPFLLYLSRERSHKPLWMTQKKKSLLDRCEFGYEGKSRGSYHFLHMDVCFVLISLLHRLWAKDKKKKSDLQSRFSVYIHDMPRSSFICSIYLKCGRIVSNYYLKKILK